jgi:NTP pyrophosphatase (non-canonical NTP hydrolase)
MADSELSSSDFSPLAAFEGFFRACTKFTHERNEKWWQDPKTGKPIQRNVGELLMLVVSELAEAMEGHRKGLCDDKLPHREMFEVELADAIIRIMDMAGGMDLDLAGAWRDKMEFNMTREDHTHAARLAPGGKAY